MGPRHASGGLGRTPNPGLAVCAGLRTRASGDRAYMGEGALLAKHCFASARTHSRQRLGRAPEGDLQRPPQPDLPRLPSGGQLLLLLLLLLWIVAGAGRSPAEQQAGPFSAYAYACRCRRRPAPPLWCTDRWSWVRCLTLASASAEAACRDNSNHKECKEPRASRPHEFMEPAAACATDLGQTFRHAPAVANQPRLHLSRECPRGRRHCKN